MKKNLLPVIFFVISIHLSGQMPQTITLENHKISSEVINPELQFIFPDFQNGYVLFKDKKARRVRLE